MCKKNNKLFLILLLFAFTLFSCKKEQALRPPVTCIPNVEPNDYTNPFGWTHILQLQEDVYVSSIITYRNNLFVGTHSISNPDWGRGIYVSSDFGKSWQNYSKGLETSDLSDTTRWVNINCMMEFSDSVFAGTDNGIYSFSEQSGTWKETYLSSSKCVINMSHNDTLAYAIIGNDHNGGKLYYYYTDDFLQIDYWTPYYNLNKDDLKYIAFSDVGTTYVASDDSLYFGTGMFWFTHYANPYVISPGTSISGIALSYFNNLFIGKWSVSDMTSGNVYFKGWAHSTPIDIGNGLGNNGVYLIYNSNINLTWLYAATDEGVYMTNYMGVGDSSNAWIPLGPITPKGSNTPLYVYSLYKKITPFYGIYAGVKGGLYVKNL